MSRSNAAAALLFRRKGDGSTLNLDFTGGSLDSRVTFSRTEATVKSTYINSSGYVTQVATLGDPRFDYDPTTLAAKGLLIEGAATNLVNQSKTFDISNGDWAISGMSRSTASVVSPSGNSETVSLIAGIGSFRSTGTTVTASTTYTFSFWAKNNGGTKAHYRVWNATAGSSIVDYSQPSASYFAQLSNTVWNRISVTFTTPAGCTSIFVYPISEDASGANLYVWGAQLELGSSASSNIHTTTSQVTRNADIAIIKTTNFSSWFTGGTTGTFFVDWYGGVRGIGTTVRSVISTDDTATKHLHLQQVSAAGALRVGDKTPTYVTTSNSLTSGARTKGAFSFEYPGSGTTSTVNVSLNGGTVATSSAMAFSVAPTFLVLGAVSTDGSALSDTTTLLNNSIRQIKYYPTALTSAQLIAMST
jgi:hypothetical protein